MVLNRNYWVYYRQTSGGAEVNRVIDLGERVIPIEIKCSEYVVLSEIKGLKVFLEDYKNMTNVGYVNTMGKNNELL